MSFDSEDKIRASGSLPSAEAEPVNQLLYLHPKYAQIDAERAQKQAGYLVAEAAQLRDFGATLSSPTVLERAVDFLPDVLEEAEKLHIKRIKIADRAETSLPSIGRWASKLVRPHILMARGVFKVVAELALEEADIRERQAEDMMPKKLKTGGR